MIRVAGYAAMSAGGPLVPFKFERREVGPTDVLIDILFCGICHSDIHSVRDEWERGHYPLVPGHEIVGRVSRVGNQVTRHRPGDRVGVGCYVNSCRQCVPCCAGLQNYCAQGPLFTYNSPGPDGYTRGGYSSQIVVDENYVLRIPPNLTSERAAPLLCAGITTYSPLKNGKVGPGHRLGVAGLGGLGHMAVKFGVAFGAEVTVFSTSPGKKEGAHLLGARNFVLLNDEARRRSLEGSLDLIVDTMSAPHNLDDLLALLRREGTLILVGAPGEPVSLTTFSLIMGRKHLSGSLIGGLQETQEMLDYCATQKIEADVEVIPMASVNDAYARILKGEVRSRFVLDMANLSLPA